MSFCGDAMKSSGRTSGITAETTAHQLARFIAKFEPATARLIRSVRRELRKRLPTATELVYDNYNFFVIGYSASERPSDCIVSIAAASNGVGLAFYHGADLPDPDKILLGSGSQNRFVRLPSLKTLDEPGVADLIRAALTQAKTPLAKTGRGRTIIRSVSAQQRPRRQKTKLRHKESSNK
jgi:hypothetical protein